MAYAYGQASSIQVVANSLEPLLHGTTTKGHFLGSTKMEGESSSTSSTSTPPPHVLIFPFPAQGHVNSMTKLALLLALSGLKITFLNTQHIQDRLFRFTDIQYRFTNSYPNFSFETITDGLPTDHPRTDGSVWELFNSMDVKTRPVFKEMLVNTTGPKFNCIIGDGIMKFVLEVALEVGIPIIHIRTVSACAIWAYFCLPDVIKAGELPIKGNEDMDRRITKVAGMETFLRCRDLPSLCRADDVESPFLQMVIATTRQSSKAQSFILNTFEDLEAPILSLIRTHVCPKTYAVGPIHELLKKKLATKNAAQDFGGQSSANVLWKVDRSCLEWLDGQPLRSVVYVSFGSITLMTRDQLIEFWYGLVNSKKKFLWVRRPGSVVDPSKDGEEEFRDVPVELLEGTKERGKIVEWAPQEEVLAHSAVGGFLTHSGWNSTLESITAGVPMICWPFFADQQVNSKFVDEVWKLGLDMKDVCDRVVVEKMVNDLMVERRDEFLSSAARMADLARRSTSAGGSSSSNLKRLIEDIKSMSVTRNSLSGIEQ